MNPFEIFIAYISWGNAGKSRPVLVFTHAENRVAVFRITTQYEIKSEAVRAKYFKINNWKQSGLEKQSYIDTGSILNLPQTVFNTKTPIGKLTSEDKRSFLNFLNK